MSQDLFIYLFIYLFIFFGCIRELFFHYVDITNFFIMYITAKPQVLIIACVFICIFFPFILHIILHDIVIVITVFRE